MYGSRATSGWSTSPSPRQVPSSPRDFIGMTAFEDMPEDVQAMADAAWLALNEIGGDEILERMEIGALSVEDGIVALLVLSGEYERR